MCDISCDGSLPRDQDLDYDELPIQVLIQDLLRTRAELARLVGLCEIAENLGISVSEALWLDSEHSSEHSCEHSSLDAA